MLSDLSVELREVGCREVGHQAMIPHAREG